MTTGADWTSSGKRRELRAALVERDGINCHWCGVETWDIPRGFTGRLPKNARTLDHVVRRCDGGEDDLSNLVIACERCNSKHLGPNSSPPITEAELVAILS